MKFKIGDKVRCINQKDYGLIKVGEITEVVKLSKNGNLKLRCYNGDFYYNSEDFELVENPKLFFYDLKPGFLYQTSNKGHEFYVKDGEIYLKDSNKLSNINPIGLKFTCVGEYKPDTLKLDTLQYEIELRDSQHGKYMKVGCQTIYAQDVLKLKEFLNERI